MAARTRKENPMNKMKKLLVCATALMSACVLCAHPGPGRHYHHGHHAGTGFAIGAGILGAGAWWLLARRRLNGMR